MTRLNQRYAKPPPRPRPAADRFDWKPGVELVVGEPRKGVEKLAEALRRLGRPGGWQMIPALEFLSPGKNRSEYMRTYMRARRAKAKAKANLRGDP